MIKMRKCFGHNTGFVKMARKVGNASRCGKTRKKPMTVSVCLTGIYWCCYCCWGLAAGVDSVAGVRGRGVRGARFFLDFFFFFLSCISWYKEPTIYMLATAR